MIHENCIMSLENKFILLSSEEDGELEVRYQQSYDIFTLSPFTRKPIGYHIKSFFLN